MIDVSLPIRLLTPEVFASLYRTGKTASDPETAIRIAFGRSDPELQAEIESIMMSRPAVSTERGKSVKKQSRAPKQLGDFGEGLVTCALIRKGFEVAYVDHVGADLIAERHGSRFAISVKTRLFKSGSKESLAFQAEYQHLDKLDRFANQFGMVPMFALVICIADEDAIHLLLARAEDIRTGLPKVKHGYAFRFAKSTRANLTENPFIDHSSWADETIGEMDFD